MDFKDFVGQEEASGTYTNYLSLFHIDIIS